jgi:hypothetical protein
LTKIPQRKMDNRHGKIGKNDTAVARWVCSPMMNAVDNDAPPGGCSAASNVQPGSEHVSIKLVVKGQVKMVVKKRWLS